MSLSAFVLDHGQVKQKIGGHHHYGIAQNRRCPHRTEGHGVPLVIGQTGQDIIARGFGQS